MQPVHSGTETYFERVKVEMRSFNPSSKKWWQSSRCILHKKQACNIPAMKATDGTWLFEPSEIANLFAHALAAKFDMKAPIMNDYSRIQDRPRKRKLVVLHISDAEVRNMLSGLREDSATGPDEPPTRVNKICGDDLVLPIRLLTERILLTGRWPQLWTEHRIVPLHKKKATWDPSTAGYTLRRRCPKSSKEL